MIEERSMAVARLWNDCSTYSEIAAILGLTRNQVAGFIFRMRRAGANLREHSGSPTADMPAAKKNRRMRIRAIASRDDVLPFGIGLLIWEASGRCVWPTGEDEHGRHLFCGSEKLEGCSYCSAHMHASFKPKKSKPRKRKSIARMSVRTSAYR